MHDKEKNIEPLSPEEAVYLLTKQGKDMPRPMTLEEIQKFFDKNMPNPMTLEEIQKFFQNK
ncbi:MAG: hypothetical protein KBC30_08870 [Planctomycetes bacterium]|nr:hypothetical protein [Planctomycetota bacterium]